MLYKNIDPVTLRLEYACPFCLSAKFAESVTLNDHVSSSCPAARDILTAAELADIPHLQISENMTMSDYYTEEESYYKNMIRLATTNNLSGLAEKSADDTLIAIIDDLKAAGHLDKNIIIAGWRIMATFFTLDDEAMERYLQIIYGEGEDGDSEDEERKVWPAPPPAPAPAMDAEIKTITILNDPAVATVAAPVPSSTLCTHGNGP
jgi:hypothetical protein